MIIVYSTGLFILIFMIYLIYTSISSFDASLNYIYLWLIVMLSINSIVFLGIYFYNKNVKFIGKPGEKGYSGV